MGTLPQENLNNILEIALQTTGIRSLKNCKTSGHGEHQSKDFFLFTKRRT